LKRRPVPRKKRNNRPEPDSKSKQRDILDKRTKKYGAVNIIFEDEQEDFAEGPEL
jgi:hypothetical protein